MPNIVVTTVEICVFRLVKRRPQYLLLKRSGKSNPYPGIWQIVTGRIEKGERAVDAALRELREETGFPPRRFWTLPTTNVFLSADTDNVHLSPVFVAEVERDAEPVLSSEHEQYQWCPFKKAIRLIPWPGQRNAIAEVHRHFVSPTEESRLSEISIHESRKD